MTISDLIAEIEEHQDPENIVNYSEKEILETMAALIKGQYLVQVEKVNHASNMYSTGIEITHTRPGKYIVRDKYVKEIFWIGKGSKRKPAVALKESTTTRNRRTKKTKVNPMDEINMFDNAGLTKDIFARIGNNGRGYKRNNGES